MPTDYNGSLTGIAARQQVTISEPAGTDVRNSASVRTPLEQLANLLQYLMQRAGLIDQVQTWTEAQTLQALLTLANNIAMTAAAPQSIDKSNGALYVGTSSAHSVFLRTGGVNRVALAPDGPIDVLNHPLINVARLLLQQLEADPAAPVDGDVWERAGKIYARLAGATQALASEAYVDGMFSGALTDLSAGVTPAAASVTINSVSLLAWGKFRQIQFDVTTTANVIDVLNLPAGSSPASLRRPAVFQANSAIHGHGLIYASPGARVGMSPTTGTGTNRYWGSDLWLTP